MIRPSRASAATMRCPISKTMLRLETPIWFDSSSTPRELLCMNPEIRCPGISSTSYWGGTWVPELLGFCVLVAVVLVVVWSSWWRRRNPSNALFFCGREAMVFFHLLAMHAFYYWGFCFYDDSYVSPLLTVEKRAHMILFFSLLLLLEPPPQTGKSLPSAGSGPTDWLYGKRLATSRLGCVSMCDEILLAVV